MSSPKSASEVAEQAVTVTQRGAYRHAVFLRNYWIDDYMEPEKAADEAYKIREQVAALISADRRERERGYDPTFTPPPEHTGFLSRLRSDGSIVLLHGTPDVYYDVRCMDYHTDELARWWPLPGPADAKEERE